MKKQIILLAFIASLALCSFSQKSIFPPVEVLKPDGTIVKASDIETGNGPVIVIFWDPDDNKCCNHIQDIQDTYRETFSDYDLKIIGICSNINGTFEHIRPSVRGSEWVMDIYLDKTGDFRRSMGVPGVPFTFLFNPEKQVVCRYNGYCTGSEDILCEKLRECMQPLTD